MSFACAFMGYDFYIYDDAFMLVLCGWFYGFIDPIWDISDGLQVS